MGATYVITLAFFLFSCAAACSAKDSSRMASTDANLRAMLAAFREHLLVDGSVHHVTDIGYTEETQCSKMKTTYELGVQPCRSRSVHVCTSVQFNLGTLKCHYANRPTENNSIINTSRSNALSY